MIVSPNQLSSAGCPQASCALNALELAPQHSSRVWQGRSMSGVFRPVCTAQLDSHIISTCSPKKQRRFTQLQNTASMRSPETSMVGRLCSVCQPPVSHSPPQNTSLCTWNWPKNIMIPETLQSRVPGERGRSTQSGLATSSLTLTSPQHEHGHLKLGQELHAVGVPVQAEVEAAQAVP